jgi:hypothetical protein
LTTEGTSMIGLVAEPVTTPPAAARSTGAPLPCGAEGLDWANENEGALKTAQAAATARGVSARRDLGTMGQEERRGGCHVGGILVSASPSKCALPEKQPFPPQKQKHRPAARDFTRHADHAR